MLGPVACLILGVVLILTLILYFRFHAFLALTCAAIVVALASDRIAPESALTVVAASFGEVMGRIGIVIVLAAIIGKCIMDSGAADRIVRAFARAFGPGRENYALLSSGFVLSTPVFFDTVFYLLAPLARAAYARTKQNYVLLVCSVGAGGLIAHSLIPPTPGPLGMAATLGIPIGEAMLGGALASIPPMILAGVFYARWIGKRMNFVPGAVAGVDEAELEAMAAKPLDALPGLFASCLPFALPVVLIAASSTLIAVLGKESAPAWVAVLGDQNLVFLLGAVFAVRLVVRQNGMGMGETMRLLEPAIASGAVIAFITCAGGAFGKVLTASGIGGLIESAAAEWGIGLLAMGFLAGALLRIAQGSATVAMLAVSEMVAPTMHSMGLTYHPMYLMAAIGLGSMGFSWMNDSGFWLFGQLTGLSEVQTLKTWSAISCIMALVGLAWVFLLTRLLPLA